MLLPFPPYTPRTKNENGKQFIFCELRKIWVRFTPEEWVRQNILQYLIQVKKYPAALIAVEKEVTVGKLKKRFDILVYKEDNPWMIIECKEQNVPLNDAVIKQILGYFSVLQTKYLLITNGDDTRCYQVDKFRTSEIKSLPNHM